MNEWVITTAIGLVISVIGYFLKRTMSQVDRHEAELRQAAGKEELREVNSNLSLEIKQIREDYTPKKAHEKDFDECRKEFKEIRANYLTKDDFIREINKMDRKLDRMRDIMMASAGKGAGDE